MTTKHSRNCLSDELLHRLSHDELSPAELEGVEEHVGGCDRCRSLLDGAQRDPLWRDEIIPILRSPAESSHTPADRDESGEGESLQSILQLLGPTDDPNMLGRIDAYEVVSVIGRGGMGVVFKAFEPALNRVVAIKMLLPHLAASGAARQRFAREGQAAAAVIDDHVMPIYCVAEWQGIPYLVMQYSRGATLQKRLKDQGPLELKEILRIGMQTARGLAAAHAQGLVHRDVKPSNIVLDGAVERALLTDFGLARAVDDASITRTGIIAGTPQYMSPEQARGGSVDARSDLFSLGGVMYAMCTARAPFRADNSHAILRLITDEEPRPIREINPDIPEWLCTLITRLMAKSPESRLEQATVVADTLEQCLAHVQQPSAVALPGSLSPPKAAAFAGLRSTSFIGALVVIASLALGLAAMLFWPVLFSPAANEPLQEAVGRTAAPEESDVPLAKEPSRAGVLEGSWAFIRTESARPDGRGAKREFEGKQRYVFAGSKLVLKTVGDDGKEKKTGEFNIALNTKVTPHRLTLKSNRDRLSIRYIYEIEGDTLRMCFFALGEVDGKEVIAWPSEFTLDKQVEKYPTLLTLKRVDDVKEAGGAAAPGEPKAGAVVSAIDDGPAWGETVDGLQLAVSGINQDGRFKSGDTIRFQLSIRNVASEVKRFRYYHPKTCNWVAPHIERANGEQVKFPVMRFRGGHKIYTETLEPNDVVSLQVLGVLVLGASDTAQRFWPRIEKPEAGEYRLRGGYLIQPLDANGNQILERGDGARRAKHAVLASGTVAFKID